MGRPKEVQVSISPTSEATVEVDIPRAFALRVDEDCYVSVADSDFASWTYQQKVADGLQNYPILTTKIKLKAVSTAGTAYIIWWDV